MKTQIKLQGQEINISAKLTAKSVYFPNSDSKTKHNQYSISISNGSENVSFNFYDSQANLSKTELNANGLKYALYCCLTDSNYADSNFEDFCSSLGYDADNKYPKRIYSICKKANEKMNLIFSDIYEAMEELREILGE